MFTTALPLASFVTETAFVPVLDAVLAAALLLIVVVLLIRPSTGAGST
ncbi:MAG: hypothetical protein KatS3mg127_1745 [Silanimonas sp.]|nr:MAG: hypothetical protein KatS3mg127_1745 [Silanimonas sp.]